MKISCIFIPCKWIYLGKGLYQCPRCKSVSWGADRDKQYIKDDEEPFPQQITRWC